MSDFSESERIVKRMSQCTIKLHDLTRQVGKARQVKEFSSDMRKNALAAEMVKAMKAGKTGVAAETEARSSEKYKEAIDTLGSQYEEAERVIAEWTATQASFDAARSLLSFSKATMSEL